MERLKVRAVIKLIEQDGWFHVRTRGSHSQYKHPVKPGLVTVAGKMSHDIAPGTLASVLKQAKLERGS
jgi:predicted RNA binding protein YcfA (HicA-like mRNA interferase family)